MPGLPISNAVLILFVTAILAAVVLTHVARPLHLRRSNEEAVRLSRQRRSLEHHHLQALAARICGVAGLLLASRINSAQPLGQGYELDAIAAR